MSFVYDRAMTLTDWPLAGFRPVGGALCLDFANTVDWRESDHPLELLAEPASLAAWARSVGRGDPSVDEADLACARALRDAVWTAFRAAVRGEPVPAQAVAILNRNLDLAPEHQRLAVSDGGVVWASRSVRGVDALLGQVARSAAEILTDPDRQGRVRMCAGDGCGWLFLDASRGARRRWCSMETCGNRAKGRAHYRRRARPKQH